MGYNFRDILVDPATAHFSCSGVTGSIGANAGTSLIWYMWNNSATTLALVRKVEIEGVIATTAFAVGQLLYKLSIARAFTAENGTPGGTALTISGPNQKLKTAFSTSLLGVIRFAGTSAIAAPTWTLDQNPVGLLNSHSSAGVNAATPIIGSQYLPKKGIIFEANIERNEAPIVLAQNEGVALQVTTPGTGVWIAGVNVKWAETGLVAG